MKEKELKGKRFIALARCSSAGQIETSIEEQLKLIESFGHAQGMKCVDRITLGGVTGSVPGVRDDIDEVIRRKREQDDFEVLLVQDASRLTRSGAVHGMHILFELRSAGVQVVFVKDDLPDDDMGDVMRTFQYYAAKEQAANIAYAVARGLGASLASGKTPHSKLPAYGIDRLYLSEQGEKKHIIRNLPDGTQAKLDPNTGEVLERFGRNPETDTPAHYIKQRNERIQLVPGAPECVEIVRQIFHRHFVEGWGYFRIAKALNSDGVPSPRGRQWSLSGIRTILRNPIYTGMGLANVSTGAVYFMRGADGPIPSGMKTKDLARRVRPRRIRKRSEWVEHHEPELANLLPESLKAAVSAKQAARLEALATGTTPSPNKRDSHADSLYILKGLLTSRQGGYPMTGRPTGKGHRYYAVGRAYSMPSEDKVLRKLVPADSLEQIVIAALQKVLTNCERVQKVIRHLARQRLHAHASKGDVLVDLQREKASVEQKISFVVDEVDLIGKEAARSKLQQLKARRQQVEDEIRRQSDPARELDDPDAVADAVCGKLSDLAAQLPNLAPTAVRNLLHVFLAELVVDLETRDAQVSFALPDWAQLDVDRMCLQCTPASKSAVEAHALPLAVYRCQWDKASASYRLRQIRTKRNAA
jgi:hypothetical protein